MHASRASHQSHVVLQYNLLKRPRTLKWRHSVSVVSITCTMEDGRVEQLQVPPLHVSLLLLLQVFCSSPSCFFPWLLLMDMRRNAAGTCLSLLQPRRCMCSCRSSGGSSMRCYCAEHVTHVSQHVTRYAVIFSKCHRHSQRCDGGGRGFVSGRRSRFTHGGKRSSDRGRGCGSTRRKPGGCRRTLMLTVCLVACHVTRVTRHDNLVSFIY